MDETIRPFSFGMLLPWLITQYLLRPNDVVSCPNSTAFFLLFPSSQFQPTTRSFRSLYNISLLFYSSNFLDLWRGKILLDVRRYCNKVTAGEHFLPSAISYTSAVGSDALRRRAPRIAALRDPFYLHRKLKSPARNRFYVHGSQSSSKAHRYLSLDPILYLDIYSFK